MNTGTAMPDDTSPSALIERLIEQLEDVRRAADHSVENECALRHARACEHWIASHQARLARRAAADGETR